ncbi:hypothetical protein C2857_006697 [Epichloe festucae Fl1]|uniref:Bud emergence protein 1 n=2 Tax=Epichloe festucae TaxID=35717 RepID=A0A7S9KLV0_EPIFF|nr:hypothetical protein C2857_006697 [Epichloe festucae Fl1]BAI50706.1 polarity protein BemA [Epichloe festucae]
MTLIQALRRSIKGDKKEQHHTSLGTKSAVAIIPPKKVIRALYDYEAQSSQELSFSKGDFFHVIGRENDEDWYEACNPALPDARGLVPVSFFQALGRTERDSAQSDGGRPPTAKSPDHDSGYSEHSPHPIATAMPISHRSTKSTDIDNKIFAIVMYDFEAQRADELGATKGEQIIIIAQSTAEWFVAKPIARLGGPGLIPVSYVEIRSVKTREVVPNALEAVRKAGVPSVEEWKKMAASYKNSSITLGKFEGGAGPGGGGGQQGIEQGMDRMSLQTGRQSAQNGSQPRAGQNNNVSQSNQFAPSQSTPQLYAPTRAWIPRYCFAEDKYWFVIVAVLDDGRHWELSRYYEDFYDFQIALLTEFPAEAGNAGGQKRTLPYMPGPVSYVTDAITEGRLHNLDAYVKNLLNQPEYISRCNLVKQFFAPREGDYEVDPNETEQEYRLSQGSQQSAESPGNNGSRSNLNGNGYAGHSATPRQTSNSQQGMPSQQQGGQAPQMKVKMYFNGDLIAIRVPSAADYQQLCDKVRERLKISQDDQLQLFYKDEPTGNKPSLMSDGDLDFALQRNEKLVLYVEVV